MPPATAKLAFAFGFDGEGIQPPPVTKSVETVLHEGSGGGEAGQPMSAWATSAPFNPPALPSETGGTSRSEVSSAPPVEGSGPVSEIRIGDSGGTVACTTYA